MFLCVEDPSVSNSSMDFSPEALTPTSSSPLKYMVDIRYGLFIMIFQQMYFGLRKNQYINIAKEEGIRSREKIPFHDLPLTQMC